MANEVSKLEAIRHSLAHLLAAAVLKLWPDAKRTIGPAIENGFYFDFEFSQPITEADLPRIEKEMRKLLPTWDEFTGSELAAEEAKKEYPNNPYKHELIDEFTKEGQKVTFYKSGDYWDLCRGGHVKHMSAEVKADAFKLTKLAGAYWRGSEKNKMLTRIYGVAFETKDDLETYLKMLEEAQKRDHKKLGAELELFFFHETAPGMPYWLPKGVLLMNELISFWREEHAKRGYHEIASPILSKKALWETSGHWEHYQKDMFVCKTGEDETFGVKAMNCPNAMVVFGSTTRSYKDLPLRLSDTDVLHRYELSGTLNGLLRARSFRQDDSHNFITEEMIGDEYLEILKIATLFYEIFKLPIKYRLGTRPESFMGDIETWNRAEAELKKILESQKLDYFVKEGDGAFYGPKIDILMQDSLGREWQTGTIQLDFQQPRRFGLEYTDRDGKKKTPIVVHRVIYGSLERFIGLLIEHTAGHLPLWLAPEQVRILPISEKQAEYAKSVAEKMKEAGLRVVIDDSSETLGKRLRQAKLMKVPYMAVLGEKEIEANAITLEGRRESFKGVGLEEGINKLKEEIKNKVFF